MNIYYIKIVARPLPRRNSQSKPNWPMLPYKIMNLEIDSQQKNKCKNIVGIRLWYFYPYRPWTELHPLLYSYYFWLWKRNAAQTTDRRIHQRLAVTRYELQRFSCRMGWDEKKNIIMVKSQTKNLRLEAILSEEIKILEEKLTDK